MSVIAKVDTPTEIAFDWLTRCYTSSADPRPAKSTLDEIAMSADPSSQGEKTWILGNSIVTIRALARRGWIEVLSRHPSGMTKFIVRAENVPMVPLGDVDSDIVSKSAMLMVDDGDGSDRSARDESSKE